MVLLDRVQIRTVNNMRIKWSLIPFLLLVMVMIPACVGQKTFSDPPVDFRESDLVGTWEAHYDGSGTGVDRLVLKEDGTFQQVYDSLGLHTFKTSWNKWHVERFPDEGRIYVHLEGARFYDDGRRVADYEGIGCPASQPGCLMDTPYPFLDPVYDYYVEMVGRLVLSVRSSPDAPGGLVLKHMRRGVDDVYSGEFYLVEEP